MKINPFKFLFATILLIAVLVALALPPAAQAQVTAGPKVYPAMAFVGTNIATSANYTNTTVTFPIKAGRGFGYNVGAWATNASGSNFISVLRFATPQTNAAGVLTTNWSTTTRGQLRITNTLNGTTRIFDQVLVPPTTVDNQTLGQVYIVTHDHLSTVWLDTTNTFITRDP